MNCRMKNLFELLSENGFNAKLIRNYLRVSSMTVGEYLNRYEGGGMKNKIFRHIADLCYIFIFQNSNEIHEMNLQLVAA